MSQKLLILDYNAGNLRSVVKKVERIGASCLVSGNPAEVLKADKIIMPGVGHFGNAVAYLKETGLYDALNEAVSVRKTPILGICLGMQLMAEYSDEGQSEGFAWVKGRITKFQVSDPVRFKVPHMGWNTVRCKKESVLNKGFEHDPSFYFVHSYHLADADPADILHETVYDYSFVSAVEKEHLFGVQYHPEKSHENGEQLMRNFLSL
jgi:glutamine amidotransferase